MTRSLGRGWTGWILPGAVLLGWEALSRLGLISPNVLPAPTAVFAALTGLVESGEIFSHIAVSTWRALAGFAIGGSIGFASGWPTACPISAAT